MSNGPRHRHLSGTDSGRATNSATLEVQVPGSDAGTATEGAIVEAEFLSILADSWVRALEPHLQFLLASQPRGWADPGGQKSGPENGHAAAAIVIGVFLLESITARIAVIRADLAPRASAHLFLRQLARKQRLSRSTADEITELFVVRDVVAHNHIWHLALRWGTGSPAEIVRRELLRGGDRKYGEAVPSGTGRTRSLALHVVPTFVGRDDAAAALSVVIELLDLLVRFDIENMTSAANSWVRVPGQVRLRDAVASLGWERAEIDG